MNLNSKYYISTSELQSNNEKSTDYFRSLKQICTLNTVEELSFILRHIKPFYNGSENPEHSYNLNIFKEGIEASWEDSKNIDGCSYLLQTRPDHISSILFERLVSYFLLKGFESMLVNGIKINIRRTFVKFEIWVESIPSAKDTIAVNTEMQKAFGVDYPLNFIFKKHKLMIDRLSTPSK